MSLQPSSVPPIPDETQRVARAAFPKGTNIYMRWRNELGTLFTDTDFADLFAKRGQPAEAPWRLALITILQFTEDLTDRQTADAVRSRIDWKYLLSLDLTDPGFDFSLLSEFRSRLVTASAEERLFTRVLDVGKERGWLKAQGRQRTDSTHILGAIRTLNRLGCVHETLRHALDVVAVSAPEWLGVQISPEWFPRYSQHLEEFRLPKEESSRVSLAHTIGRDGYHLLNAIYSDSTIAWLWAVPAIQTLRVVWLQHYSREDDGVQWRATEDMPPAALLIVSPHDPAVRASTKRATQWMGYKVHVTESCDDETPHLITHVETTSATTADVDMLAPIHAELHAKDMTPHQHYVDAGYTDAENLATSESVYAIDVIGPVSLDQSWQAKAQTGFTQADFQFDADKKQATCPAGQVSKHWGPTRDRHGKAVLKIVFAPRACQPCPSRTLCTRDSARILTVRHIDHHIALEQARQRQKTDDFWKDYTHRAGIEATLSQAVNAFPLRRTRYIGTAKTHLQHLVVATALNLTRMLAWMQQTPRVVRHTSRFAALAPAT